MRRALAVIALLAIVLVVGMYAAGWMTFERTPGRLGIELNTQEIDEAAQRAAETSREVLHEAADSVEQATDDDGDANDDRPGDQRPVVEVKTDRGSTTTVTP